jgi:hypothetical protein
MPPMPPERAAGRPIRRDVLVDPFMAGRIAPLEAGPAGVLVRAPFLSKPGLDLHPSRRRDPRPHAGAATPILRQPVRSIRR